MVRYRRDEELIAEAIKSTRRGTRDALRPTGTEKARTTAAVEDALERVGDIEEAREDEAHEAAKVPVPPVQPSIVSNVGGWAAAGPVAAVALSVPPVTVSTDGEPVEVAEYEWYLDEQPFARTPAPSVQVTLPSEVVRAYRVLAITAQGVRGDLSPARSVTGAVPAVAVRNPTGPTLTTGAGNAFAAWDGTYATGGTAGAHTVAVEARIGAGAWLVQDTLTVAGQKLIRLGAVGETVQVRFRAYDQLGRLTGTSATASIQIVGIEFDDFDTVVTERILDTEEKIAAVENGQLLIEKVASGLNHMFTSAGSPGRGFIGYENLAPPIVGSGVWAETRRNRAKAPIANDAWPAQYGTGGAGDAETFLNSGGTPVRRMTWTTPPTAGNVRLYFSPVNRITVEPGEVLEISVDAGSDGMQLSFAVDWHNSGGSWFQSAPTEYHSVSDDPDHLTRITRTTPPAPEGAASAVIFLRTTVGQIAPGSTIYAANLLVGDSGAFFDGGTPDRMVDPDQRTRWLGAVNSSESVMEIERVAGYSGYRAIPGLSAVEGQPAVRIIPTGEGTNPMVNYGIPLPARTGGAALGTLHLAAPQIAPGGNARRLRVNSNNAATTVVSGQAPNEPGSFPLRVAYGDITAGTAFQSQLYNGDNSYLTDARYTDIGLYAGTLPEDAQRLHQGDLWRKLGYKPGVNPGDPDRLVVEQILVWDGQDWVENDIWAENLFAAGSVTARVLAVEEIWANEAWLDVLRAGVIETDMVTSNFGENLNLEANGEIILVAGRQDDLASQVGEAQDTADAALAGVEANETAVSAAAAAAVIADGKALVAQARAETANGKADALGSRAVVTPQGLDVRSQDAEYVFRITPTGAAIIHAGVPMSEWTGAQFISNEVVTNGLQFAGHKATKSGTRTVIRAL